MDLDARVRARSEGLAAEGIDAANFLRYAAAVALPAGEDEEKAEAILDACARLARVVAGKKSDGWSAFHFGAEAIARAFPDDPGAVAGLVDDVAALVAALADGGLESLALQRLPAAIHAASGKPWLARAGFALFCEIAAAGADPGEAIRLAFPALAQTAAAADEPAFAPLATALRETFSEMDDRGVPPTWPIAQGVVALATTLRDDPRALADSLRRLAELAITLQSAGIVPHPAIEYGLTQALEGSRDLPWLVAEIFPFAFAVAAAGRDPILVLQRMPQLREAGGERGPRLAGTLRALAERGLDLSRFLQSVPAFFAAAAGDDARAESLFRQGVEVLEALHARSLRTAQLFEEGIPRVLATPVGAANAERVLALSLRLAGAGIDAGPTILHGLGSAFERVAARFEAVGDRDALAAGILDGAEALVSLPVDPWRFLDPGVYAASQVSGGDREAMLALLGELLALAEALAARGLDPGPFFQYGVYGLASNLQGDDRRATFSETIGLLADFAPALAARRLDPSASAGRGVTAIARLAEESRAPWMLAWAVAFALALADGGFDPAGMLERGIPALGAALGADRAALERAGLAILHASQTLRGRPMRAPFEEIVQRAMEVESDRAAALDAALVLACDGASSDRDLSAAAAILVPVLARRGPALPALLDEARRFCAAARPLDEPFSHALAAAADVAGGDARALRDVLEGVARAERTARGEDPGGAPEAEDDPGRFLSAGVGAAARAANSRPAVFLRLVERLAARVARARAAGERLGPAMALAWSVAAAGTQDVFIEAMETLFELARIDATTPAAAEEQRRLVQEILDRVVPLALAAAAADPRELPRRLREILDLRADGKLDADRYVFWCFDRLRALVHRRPLAWREVIVPTLRSQPLVARTIFEAIERIQDSIDDDGALALLKHVVTQEGVRAREIVWTLFVEGLQRGAIRSLSGEREALLAFLREVPIVEAGFYREYRDIVHDANRTDAERREAIGALRTRMTSLQRAVVDGEVPADREEDPLLSHVLFHVFPPAVSATRDTYLWLFRERADHPEHMRLLAKTGIVARTLPRGGYVIREGEEIDLAPWATLREVVRAEHAAGGGEAEAIDALGRDLFAAWIETGVGTAEVRTGFLRRLYARQHRHLRRALPEDPRAAEELLRYREFLADTAREIVQEALRAARRANPERYDRLVAAKMTHRPHVGPGLVAACLACAEQRRAGRIEGGEAASRLARILKSWETGERAEAILAARDAAAMKEAIESLPLKERAPEPGAEHVRLLQDLTGAELAAMQRELFGDGHQRGKLEYRSHAEGTGLPIELEVSKRRAHVDVGMCEGVCTAVDRLLWDDARFLHCIVWGADDRALGGMHLLAVEHPGLPRALALPGINPSLDLLAESGAAAVLEVLLAHAVQLARENGFDAVWIPDERGILSNRGPIHAAVMEKDLPRRSIPRTQFSHSPYSYSFDRVLEVWTRDGTG